MKLNMGCGNKKLPGYVNVDAFAYCEPDVQFDLETFPWPWPDNSVDAVLFKQSLEHMGATSSVFLKIMKELYRICKDGAEVDIQVPHPRSDYFIGDPTHVRIITPTILRLFDKELNDQWALTLSSATPLAHYLNVDFKIKSYIATIEEPYKTRYETGQITLEELNTFSIERNNVLNGFLILLNVIK